MLQQLITVQFFGACGPLVTVGSGPGASGHLLLLHPAWVGIQCAQLYYFPVLSQGVYFGCM